MTCNHLFLSPLRCSNYDVFLVRDLLSYARIPPATNQIETHPYFQRDSLVRLCLAHGISVTAHTPLGGGQANTDLFGSASPLDDPLILVSTTSQRPAVARSAQRSLGANTLSGESAHILCQRVAD